MALRATVERESTYLCVPEMRRQVIALLPELDRDDFVHVKYFLTMVGRTLKYFEVAKIFE